MEEHNTGFTLSIMIGAAFIMMGIILAGAQLKYGATRYACITQGWSAQQCADWNTLFENN